MKTNIFPSKNEKIITVAIISFVLGMSFGLLTALENIDKKELVPSVAALFAAFFGASTAFFLESRSRRKEQKARHLDASNQLLYVIFERLNAIKLFQEDFVEPVRDDPAKMIKMEPMANYRAPESELKIEQISFMFKTSHRSLMFELHVVNELFHETVNSIRFRSDLFLDECQPLIENAGHRSGDLMTDKMILNAIGERNYVKLDKSTDVVIWNVDKFIEKTDKLRSKLISAFTEVFSTEEIFAYELKS